MARSTLKRLTTTVDLTTAANLAEPTWDSYLRGLQQAAKKATRPRFSIVKARQYVQYTQSTSTLRQAFVVCLMPLPGMLASLVMPLIPLQDPTLGVRGNSWYFLHLTLTIGYTAVSAVNTVRDVTGITREEYPNIAVAVVATITTGLLVGMFVLMGLYWRFPVPFAPVVVYVPWLICITFAHIVTLRGHLKSRRLRNHLLFYLPSLSVQVSQLVIYPAYSALFNSSGQWVQAILIGLFPVLKFVIKQQIAIANHHISDSTREEAVSAVEISASMYQSMIVQGTPSPFMTGLVIATDVVLGIVDLWRLIHQNSILSDIKVLHIGIAILEQSPPKIFKDDQLHKYATKTTGYFDSAKQKFHTNSCCRSRPVAPTPLAVTPLSKTLSFTKESSQDERIILTQALEMLQSIETILLIEYLEVIVPLMNVVYVAVAAQLPSAIYNAKLRSFVGHKDQLVAALVNMVLYSLLQGATLVAVIIVIRVRYGRSPLAQIAFALEKHFASIQGKLISWIPTILAFSVAHYGMVTYPTVHTLEQLLSIRFCPIGVDFTFRFDFRTKPLE